MNDKLEAMESARKFAAQFRGLLKGMDALGEIGSIEQATAEARQRLDTAHAEHAKAIDDHKAEIAKQKRLLEDVQSQVAAQRQAIFDQRKAADGELKAKRERGEQIVAEANSKAIAMISDGRKEADKIVTDARASIASLNEQARFKQAEIASTQAALDKIRAELAQVEDAHRAFLAKIGAH